MGILISMNLKWLPSMVSQRQALGLDTIRYHFEPTQYEALAMWAGNYTFYFDQDRALWKAAGQRETQAPTFRLASPPLADHENLREVCQTGLQSTRPIALRLKTIADQDLLPGDYELRLLLVCPSSEAEGDSIVNLTLAESEGAIEFTTGSRISVLISRPKRIDVVRQAGGKDRALQISYPVNIHAGSLLVQLQPVKGSVYLCGIVLAPGSLRKSQPV
jgi:hypothetical protein